MFNVTAFKILASLIELLVTFVIGNQLFFYLKKDYPFIPGFNPIPSTSIGFRSTVIGPKVYTVTNPGYTAAGNSNSV